MEGIEEAVLGVPTDPNADATLLGGGAAETGIPSGAAFPVKPRVPVEIERAGVPPGGPGGGGGPVISTGNSGTVRNLGLSGIHRVSSFFYVSRSASRYNYLWTDPNYTGEAIVGVEANKIRHKAPLSLHVELHRM